MLVIYSFRVAWYQKTHDLYWSVARGLGTTALKDIPVKFAMGPFIYIPQKERIFIYKISFVT